MRWQVIGTVAIAAMTGVCACKTTYDVERRETPVHVWLTAPALAEAGGTLNALIYVGPYKVVQGPVQFSKGNPTVNLPGLFIRAGEREVAAVFDGGRASARDTVEIEGESWIQIVVEGTSVRIRVDDEQPDPWGG